MLSSSGYSEQQELHERFDLCPDWKRKSHFVVPALKLKLSESTVARMFIPRSCAADGS
jgi:hypothetical protein